MTAQAGDRANFFLPAGYVSRPEPKYLKDFTGEFTGVVHQPEVYALARELGRRFGCRRIIDLGCGRADKLHKLIDEFEIIGVDFGSNIDFCRRSFPAGRWIDFSLENRRPLPLERTDVEGALVVCSDVIEHLLDPIGLLENLHGLMEYAAAGLLSTPDRDRLYGPGQMGPPANPHHLREWNRSELEQLCRQAGLRIGASGWTLNNDFDRKKTTTLLVLENNHWPNFEAAPESFRVAGLFVANQDDPVVGELEQELIEQGIALVPVAPPADFDPKDLSASRRLMEKAADGVDADWILFVEPGERFCSPWPTIRVRDALWRVQQLGWSAVEGAILRLAAEPQAPLALREARSVEDAVAVRRAKGADGPFPLRFPMLQTAVASASDGDASAEFLFERLAGSKWGSVVACESRGRSHRNNPLARREPDAEDPDLHIVYRELVGFVAHCIRSAAVAVELGPTPATLRQAIQREVQIDRYIALSPHNDPGDGLLSGAETFRFDPDQSLEPRRVPKGAVDLLLALDSLHRLADPWDRLAEAATLLKPGGLAVVSVPNVQNIRTLLRLVDGHWDYGAVGMDPAQLRFFTLTGLHELVQGAGLELQETSATLLPPIDMASVADDDNRLQLGKTTLAGLTRDEVVRLFARRYHVLARRPD